LLKSQNYSRNPFATNCHLKSGRRSTEVNQTGSDELKIAILDDYLNVVRSLKSFSKLDGHDVTIWNDHTEDVDEKEHQ
jgi:hypothetical protein